MAWLTTCTDENKVIGEELRYYDYVTVTGAAGIGVTWRVNVTKTEYTFVGITYETAVAQQIAELAANPSCVPRISPIGDSDGYNLSVSLTVVGSWEQNA